jgi:excisionase family DNA binding protein
MKTDQNKQTYISTSQAAKMLGLSIGTVQRMVQSGLFTAFLTHGGHRRILTSSLKAYCAQQGFTPLNPLPELGRAYLGILHSSENISPAVKTLAQWPQILAMTHPLDLVDLSTEINAIFIDARIPWLHTGPLHLDSDRLPNTHLVVYNSTHLPAGSPLSPGPQLSLFEGDISCDLVYGYWLSTRHAQQDQAAHH